MRKIRNPKRDTDFAADFARIRGLVAAHVGGVSKSKKAISFDEIRAAIPAEGAKLTDGMIHAIAIAEGWEIEP